MQGKVARGASLDREGAAHARQKKFRINACNRRGEDTTALKGSRDTKTQSPDRKEARDIVEEEKKNPKEGMPKNAQNAVVFRFLVSLKRWPGEGLRAMSRAKEDLAGGR